MSESIVTQENFDLVRAFFDRDVCQRATIPLRDGIEIALYIDGTGPLTLRKRNGQFSALNQAPSKPDMTFGVTLKGIKQLNNTTTQDIGEIGVEILKLMAQSDPEYRMTAKVHIGLFDLLRHGYLSVLPLGGATVMKFLGAKGFTGIGKIKDAISRLRT